MNQPKSVFRRGAEFGLPMGCYLSVMSVAAVFADRVAPLSWVMMLLLLLGPVFVWFYQRRYFREMGGMAEYAALWMVGILMIIYGALICGLVTWCVIQWGRPLFMYEQLQAAIDVYSKMPELQQSELLKTMQNAIDTNSLPSPIGYVSNMFWLTTSTGSLMAAITAAFARLNNNKYS